MALIISFFYVQEKGGFGCPKVLSKAPRKNVRCYVTMCGCCPDGVSTAVGPGYQGCKIRRPAIPKGL